MPVKVEAIDGDVSVEGINIGSPRTEMKENTKKVPTLATIRYLADEDAEMMDCASSCKRSSSYPSVVLKVPSRIA